MVHGLITLIHGKSFHMFYNKLKRLSLDQTYMRECNKKKRKKPLEQIVIVIVVMILIAMMEDFGFYTKTSSNFSMLWQLITLFQNFIMYIFLRLWKMRNGKLAVFKFQKIQKWHSFNFTKWIWSFLTQMKKQVILMKPKKV